MALPNNKHTAWKLDITKMIEQRRTCHSKLDTVIGRLGNIGMIMTPIYHFLSRLRELQRRSKNRRSIAIDDTCIKELNLMLFLWKKLRMEPI